MLTYPRNIFLELFDSATVVLAMVLWYCWGAAQQFVVHHHRAAYFVIAEPEACFLKGPCYSSPQGENAIYCLAI